MQSIESRRDQLIFTGIIVQVACYLVLDKLVERQVVVEGTYQPGTVRREIPVEVFVHSIGISQSHQVGPVPRHMLAVCFVSQPNGPLPFDRRRASRHLRTHRSGPATVAVPLSQNVTRRINVRLSA